MQALILTTLAVFAQADARPTIYQSNVRLAQAPAYYHADNPITTTHECTHWANSRLRQSYRGGAMYLGNGRFLWVRIEPPITLGSVQRYVRHRGRLFNQYLNLSRYPLTPQPYGPGTLLEGHEQQPLFLFDELSAYMAGASVAVRSRGDYSDRVQAACEMAHYAASMWRATPRSYPDREELRRIWIYMALQIDAICRKAAQVGQYRMAPAWHRVLVDDITRMRAGQ